MNQSKFSLADALTVAATIIFGFFCFLSFNFLYLGETKQSIIWAASLALVLGVTAFILKLLKRTTRNFRNCIIWEGILLLFFIVVAIIAIFPFSQYFTVTAQKEEIQTKVNAGIMQAERMFLEYEAYSKDREQNYSRNLHSVVMGRNIRPSEYWECGFVSNIDDSTQIENKKLTLHFSLFPSNFIEKKQADSTWLAKARKTMDKWKPIGLVAVVNEVKSNSEKWLEELIQSSSYRAQCETETTEDFDYELIFEDVTSELSELGKPTIISIVTAVALYLLMLLSYFISKRSTKSIVLKKRKSNYSIDY